MHRIPTPTVAKRSRTVVATIAHSGTAAPTVAAVTATLPTEANVAKDTSGDKSYSCTTQYCGECFVILSDKKNEKFATKYCSIGCNGYSFAIASPT